MYSLRLMFLTSAKSITSGVLLESVGQEVVVSQEATSNLFAIIVLYSCLPLGLMSLDPQKLCLALYLPAAINLLAKRSKTRLKFIELNFASRSTIN